MTYAAARRCRQGGSADRHGIAARDDAVADGILRRLRVHRAGPVRGHRLRDHVLLHGHGLSLRPALAPLILLLTLLNVGYVLSLFEVASNMRSIIWVAVSVFLSLTGIFFAAMLGTNTEARLRWLLRGYVAAAVIVSFLAIGGYFGLFGGLSGRFVLHSRATGTFKDPNVFAAFLVLPGLLILQRMLAGRRSEFLGGGLLLLILMGGLFLSFSRAAWGQFVFCAIMLMALTFVTSRSDSERVRIIAVAILGTFLAAASLAVLLSLDQVAALFQERASLTQGYDTGPTGRFGRYFIAISMTLDHPFGMGPLQFLFPEAPHNAYLNAFVTGGWISGAAYLTLTLVTLVAGLRFVLVRTSMATDLPRRLCGLRRRRLRKHHHRQRPLAPLFPHCRRAVGLDGGLAKLPARARRPHRRRNTAATGLNTAPLRIQPGHRIRSPAGIGGA